MCMRLNSDRAKCRMQIHPEQIYLFQTITIKLTVLNSLQYNPLFHRNWTTKLLQIFYIIHTTQRQLVTVEALLDTMYRLLLSHPRSEGPM